MARRGLFVAMLAVLIVSAGCSRPSSYEKFITISRSVGGIYSFELDLSDSLALWDLSFYTRSTASDTLSLPLLVLWESPSGGEFQETVYMAPPRDGYSKELYRSAFGVQEPGLWKLHVRPLAIPRGFCGLGIICVNNGTRQTP